MKRIFFLILLVVPFTVTGQKITFNSFILSQKDSSVAAISDFWKLYLADYTREFDKTSARFWNNIEIEQGFTDIVRSAIYFPVSRGSEFTVFEIKKVDNDFYRIRNILSLGDSDNKMISGIFNVYARKEKSGLKLYNNFFLEKSKLRHYQIHNIDFYYPENYLFNSQKAKLLTDKYREVGALFNIGEPHRLTYIIGNNLEEAYNFIGIDYNPVDAPSPFAGRFIENQNIVISCREDHIHELIHAIFMPVFPKGHSLFHEGIATYYGGANGKNYPALIERLKMDIINKPLTDLSEIEDLDKNLDNGDFNNFYTIGAIIIDYALKNGGTEKVLALLNYPVTNPDNFDDDIAAITKEMGIGKDQLNAFLRRYVQNYKGD